MPPAPSLPWTGRVAQPLAEPGGAIRLCRQPPTRRARRADLPTRGRYQEGAETSHLEPVLPLAHFAEHFVQRPPLKAEARLNGRARRTQEGIGGKLLGDGRGQRGLAL